MKKNSKQVLLFLVGNDAFFLNSLVPEFRKNGDNDIQTYLTGELCLESISDNPDIIILDYNLNGACKNVIGGLETLDRIKAIRPEIPVIMLSSHDTVGVAAACINHQASDCIVKSETAFLHLHTSISSIIHCRMMEKTLAWYMDQM